MACVCVSNYGPAAWPNLAWSLLADCRTITILVAGKVARIGKAIFTSDGARESKPVSNLQPLIGRQRLVASYIFQKKRLVAS